jgi:hypothetical protein
MLPRLWLLHFIEQGDRTGELLPQRGPEFTIIPAS